MLTSLFIFSLKASAILGVLYLAYYVLFKQNTHFHIRRGLLLFILAAACILPEVQMETNGDLFPENPSIQMADELVTVNQAEITLKPQTVTESEVTDANYYQPNSMSERIAEGKVKLIDLASIIYLLGLSYMFISFLYQLSKIGYLAIFGPVRHDLDRNIITHKWVRFPFSFGKWIFIPTDTSYDAKTWELIRMHEQAHLRQVHSIDVLLSGLVRCLLWFNPVAHLLHREIKNNHESLADESILKKVNLATYSEALLKVSLQTGSLNLGHAFALKSNLSKRIKTMQRNKTAYLKTSITLLLFVVIGFGIFTQTSLYSQQDRKMPTRDELLKRDILIPFTVFELAPRHQKVMDKLQALNPEKEFRVRYMEEARPEFISNVYSYYRKPEYFTKLTDEDKIEIYNSVFSDTARYEMFYGKVEMPQEQLLKILKAGAEKLNYLVIYEPHYSDENDSRNKVYEMDDVDAQPNPIGGLDAFQRAIALDAEIPAEVDKADLPETVDFSFIVYGGNRISHLNLETKLRGSKKKNEKIYRFFGTLHKDLQRKITSFYDWEKGIKDGDKVNVRMIVSIPTKFM